MNDIIIKAILNINPTAEVTVSGNDINTIQWHNGTTPIPKADIEAKMVEVQADYDAKQYQRDRVYPSIGRTTRYAMALYRSEPSIKISIL
jgi:hypothetical protein